MPANCNARAGIRTPTPLQAEDFKSNESTDTGLVAPQTKPIARAGRKAPLSVTDSNRQNAATPHATWVRMSDAVDLTGYSAEVLELIGAPVNGQFPVETIRQLAQEPYTGPLPVIPPERPLFMARECLVYAIRRPDVDEVKIGITRDLPGRLYDLQSSHGVPLVVVFTLRGDSTREKEIHRLLRPEHMHREMFRISPRVADWLDRQAKGIPERRADPPAWLRRAVRENAKKRKAGVPL